jgi:hypothetical protein
MTRLPPSRFNRKAPATFMKCAVVLIAGALIAASLAYGPTNAAGNGLHQSASGVEAFIGLVPAEITKGHAPTGPEGAMHGGAPAGVHQYHLIAAVFVAGTGARIADAAVTAQVSGLGLAGPEKVLDPMTIAGTVTYGAYFDLPGPDLYTIVLTINRPASAQPVTLKFTYDHRNQ